MDFLKLAWLAAACAILATRADGQSARSHWEKITLAKEALLALEGRRIQVGSDKFGIRGSNGVGDDGSSRPLTRIYYQDPNNDCIYYLQDSVPFDSKTVTIEMVDFAKFPPASTATVYNPGRPDTYGGRGATSTFVNIELPDEAYCYWEHPTGTPWIPPGDPNKRICKRAFSFVDDKPWAVRRVKALEYAIQACTADR